MWRIQGDVGPRHVTCTGRQNTTSACSIEVWQIQRGIRDVTGAGRQNTTSACSTERCQTPEDVTLYVLDVRTLQQPPALKPSVGHPRTSRYTCRTSEHHTSLYHGSVSDTRGRHITSAGRQNTTSACSNEAVFWTSEGVALHVLLTSFCLISAFADHSTAFSPVTRYI